MSPRHLFQKSWAEAQSRRVAAIRHAYQQCIAPSTRRTFSSTPKFLEANGGETQNPESNSYKIVYPKQSRNRRIFSLIQPTGIPHLGNYLGALRSWKDFQDERDVALKRGRNLFLNFGIADLHSLTSTQDPATRRDQIRKTFASLLAMGLDPKKSLLFLQSDVHAHSELMWILSNVASTGYLSRMTQWKEKIGLKDPQSSTRSIENLDEKSQEKLKLSLFSYPVLQAADILLYQPDTVPVGEDQAQHVEFTRQLARSFNARYCLKNPILRIPELMLSPAKRVMSLQDPTKKMSKSDSDPLSRILITDTEEGIKFKFKKAKTDSLPGPITYSPIERPGISNLIDIYKHIQRSPKSQDAIAADCKDMTLGAFKALVANAVIKELAGVRERYNKLVHEDNQTLDAAIISGRNLASSRAGATMLKVREAIGLYTVGRGSKSKISKSDELEDGEDERSEVLLDVFGTRKQMALPFNWKLCPQILPDDANVSH